MLDTEEISLSDCVQDWMKLNVDHPSWFEAALTFHDMLNEGPITSPPEQLFACVWCHYHSILNVRLSPQFHIGKYRADFTVSGIDHFVNAAFFAGDIIEKAASNIPRYAIEIDGFTWHDKTPQQAEHDKRRDRFIQSQGYQVLRFAAREVLRAPEACTGEVFNRIMSDIKAVYARFTLA